MLAVGRYGKISKQSFVNFIIDSGLSDYLDDLRDEVSLEEINLDEIKIDEGDIDWNFDDDSNNVDDDFQEKAIICPKCGFKWKVVG